MDEIHCPLCCNNTFTSQQSLVKHLMDVLENIRCPLCHNQLASIASLIEHISLSNCQEQNSIQTIVFIEDDDFRETHENSHCNPKMPCVENQNADVEMPSEQSTEVNNEIGNIYVELLKKDSMNESLQENHDLKLQEDEEGQFVLVSHEDSSSGTTIVTKQNRDGTISVTTEKVNSHSKTVPEERLEQMYSCNTCGVTFSSVLDHIQNYHNDQDVVVEDHLEETEESFSMEYNNSDDSLDKERNVVVDVGKVMEAPMLKVEPLSKQVTVPVSVVDSHAVDKSKKVDQVVNKQVPLRQYTLIEKFCDSYVMEIKRSNDDKNRPFHNIVIKEMRALDNGNKVKVFNCVSCNLYVTDLEDFKDKPCNARYPCPHCSVAYDNAKSLSAHMKVHKGDVVRYSCPHCSVVYDNAKSLSAHIKIHKKDSAPFACEICGTVFGTNKSLKLHKRMHDPIKPRPIEPPVQSENSEDIIDNFVCTICDKVIPLDYRSVHERSHSDEEIFNCDICNRKFTTYEFLEMHLKIHNMDKAPVNKQEKTLPYSCSYCTRQFARPHEKVKHERIHTGEKPHSCEICGKSFRVSYCLTLHMRTHTGARPYECSHCGKKFKAHSVYNHHLLTHSEVRAYKCPYCPKAFKTSVQLAGHKNSHTKPFACQYCNRPFASLYAVRVHTETHQRQNNLKFACELCGATYARTFALKDHMRQAHQQEMHTKVEKSEDWGSSQEPEEERIHMLKDLLVDDKSEK